MCDAILCADAGLRHIIFLKCFELEGFRALLFLIVVRPKFHFFGGRSVRIEYTTTFDCGADELWPFLTEPDLQKRWMKGLLDNELTSEGEVGVGSTFRMSIKEGKQVGVYEGKFVGYDKPRLIDIEMSGGCFEGRMRIIYNLTEAKGETRLDYLCDAEMTRAGVFMKLMMPICKIFVKQQLKGFMKTLHRLVEEQKQLAAA